MYIGGKEKELNIPFKYNGVTKYNITTVKGIPDEINQLALPAISGMAVLLALIILIDVL